jgi:hypothetical protein
VYNSVLIDANHIIGTGTRGPDLNVTDETRQPLTLLP